MISEDERIARGRFMIINFVRLFALVIAFTGAANIGGHILPEYAPLLGQFLLAIAAIDFFLAPIVLKRMWRSKDQ